MKYCPKCNKEYVDTLNYCTDDGTPLVVKPDYNLNEEKEKKPSQQNGRKSSWVRYVLLTIVAIVVAFVCLCRYAMNAATYLKVEPCQLSASKSGCSVTVDIDYDGYVWTINHKPDWVDVYEKEKGFDVHVGKNTTGKFREGSITIQSGKQLAQVKIEQKCFATYLNISTNQLHFKRDGGCETVNIETDGGDWVATYPNYLQVEKVDEKTLSIKANANADVYKSGYITIKEDFVSSTIYVSQGGKCNYCLGEGKVDCRVCLGQGHTGFSMYYEYYEPCLLCGSSGKIACDLCKGTGYKE